MTKSLLILFSFFICNQIYSQNDRYKTQFIHNVEQYRLPAPPSKNETADVLAAQGFLYSAGQQRLLYWNAGAPNYRWTDMMFSLFVNDTSRYGGLAYMVMEVATYDALVAAFDSKKTYKRKRPFQTDKRIRLHGPVPASPSYPCEYSVAAGVASAIIAHYYPKMKDSVEKMSKWLMDARVAAGVAYPSDTKAGFELGQKIANIEIESTKSYVPEYSWDGKIPVSKGSWNGKFALMPLLGKNKTVFLDSSSQYRPGPPPDYRKEMEELKNFRQSYRSMWNAYFWANESFWEETLSKRIFEYNIHLDPLKAAKLYAITAMASYDAIVACWDAKYAYWGIRPDQYDTTFKPILFFTPPFPGYPSGHAVMSGVTSELYGYFFPADKAYFRRRAKDAAESRFQGGIHFRSDNQAGLELGRKIAAHVIKEVEARF
ncbi:MAG: hypothetical protein JNK79_08130 [Chitinophagaceae bacterium]|nr:hypothetical protein [Chitinophagaceae bacterium]